MERYWINEVVSRDSKFYKKPPVAEITGGFLRYKKFYVKNFQKPLDKLCISVYNVYIEYIQYSNLNFQQISQSSRRLPKNRSAHLWILS